MTFRRLFDAAFLDNGALTETLVSATPLASPGSPRRSPSG